MRPEYGVVFILCLALVIPMLVALGPVLFHRHLGKWKGKRSPQKTKMLRAPGESLKIKIEKLEEDLNFSLALSFALPGFLLAALLAPAGWARANHYTFQFIIFLILVSAVGFGLYLYRQLSQLRQYRIGFSGERAVGEALNPLLAHGCQVFHDFEFPDLRRKWNIDHIVVAPDKVYAIETKTRRKSTSTNNGEDHRFTFDGKALIFHEGRDTKYLEQALRNASSLSEWLGKVLGEPISVQPVLTLPGWFVDRKGKGSVWVVNPKEIRNALKPIRQPSGPEIKLQKQIAYQIEQRCRDVEF